MATADVRGTTLYYTESGTGAPLVLVHGTGGNADVWAGVLPALSRTHRVIAYDRRGYQRSAGPAPPTAVFHREHGEDLAALLQQLQAVPATVVGWSAGSFAALHAALNQPRAVEQLVLYEPPLHAKAHITWPLFKTFALVGLAGLVRQPQAGADAFLRMVMAYADGRSTWDTLPPELRARMTADAPALLAELKAGTGEELTAATLSTGIRMPVSLMIGEQTPQLFVSAMQRVRTIFPQAPVATIARGNHFAQIDRPEAFVAACRTALGAGR